MSVHVDRAWLSHAHHARHRNAVGPPRLCEPLWELLRMLGPPDFTCNKSRKMNELKAVEKNRCIEILVFFLLF